MMDEFHLMPIIKWQFNEDPNFDFFGYAKAVMQKRGYRGLTLEEKANETIQRLLFNMQTGGLGPVFSHYDGRVPFDAYYKMAVQRRSLSELRDDKKDRDLLPTVNIKPSGKDEITPGVSEETIGDDRVEGPNDEYLDQTFKNMLGHLARQRDGELLVLIFRLMAPEPMGEGMTQYEITEYLNRNKIPSATRTTVWSPGMVNSYITKIRAAIRIYVDEEDKGEDGEGTLRKLMTKDKPKLPKEVGQAYWKINGDEMNRVPVRVRRRQTQNTAIVLPDGSSKTVPTKEMEFPN
jgi:hypothetical protein